MCAKDSIFPLTSQMCLFVIVVVVYIVHILNGLKRECYCIFFIFFSNKCWISVRFAAADNWFKPPMYFIDRTKAVNQYFYEKSCNWKLKKPPPEKLKNNNKNRAIYLCLLRFCKLRVSVCICTGHFVMVSINLTCPHCLHHFYMGFCTFTLMYFSWTRNTNERCF